MRSEPEAWNFVDVIGFRFRRHVRRAMELGVENPSAVREAIGDRTVDRIL
ncbi:hypothetical protein ACQCSV_02395 [Pseudarthrobacter sp. S3]